MAITGSSSSAAATDAAPEPVEIVVGFPTRGGADADQEAVVREVASAFARRDPSVRWRLIVADTGTGDSALGRMRDALGAGAELVEVRYALQPSDSLNVPYHGLSARARALRAILEQARGTRGCVILDPRSGAPSAWLDHLLQPLIDEAADFVAPEYCRHPFTGGLVHGLVYPMFRALYGVRLRYPVSADAACSPRLIEAILPDPIWQSDAGQVGIDLWMAATAASGGFRMAQTCVGNRTEARAGLDLSTTVSQLVGCLFLDMERRAAAWQRIRGSRALPQFGAVQPTPAPPDIDAATLVESFRLGHRELQDVWAEVLPPLAILQWRRLATMPIDAFRVDDALWARTVYDFAMGHRLRVIARDHLLRSLTPLYLGWLASLVREVGPAPPEEAQARIERLCLVFEAEKPYLISQWRWPERFRPVKLRR